MDLFEELGKALKPESLLSKSLDIKEMNILSKTEKVKRWLDTGKTLTQRQAINHFQSYRLAVIKQRLNEGHYYAIDKEIVDLNEGTGKHSIYKLGKLTESTKLKLK